MAIRKGKYETFVESRLTEIEGWCRDGFIDSDIAKKLGIAYSTFRLYKQTHSALSAALQKGKEVIDYEVENALLKRALGYEYKEVTKEIVLVKKTVKGEEKRIVFDPELKVTKEVTKHMAPDVAACFIWLKNRRPDKWRDRPKDFGDSDENNSISELVSVIEESAKKYGLE